MTDLDKDYKFYKAKEWLDRPAYYVEGEKTIDKGRIEANLLHKQKGATNWQIKET